MLNLLRSLFVLPPAVHKYRDGYAIAYYDQHRKSWVAPQLVYTGGPSAVLGKTLAEVLPDAARYRTRRTALRVARYLGR